MGQLWETASCRVLAQPHLSWGTGRVDFTGLPAEFNPAVDKK